MVELSKKRMARFESFLATSNIANAKEDVLAFRNDSLVRRALDSDIDILGQGDFGIVRKVVLNGVSLAVKYCNRFTGHAQQYLNNEILINCHIASKIPHLMGSCIPGLVAVGFDDWAGPVLITEMVGNVFNVDISKGHLSVGRKQLHSKLTWVVCNAAVGCLKALHSCGILHRDVKLGNLRALIRREGSFQDMMSWGVDNFDTWWVDLGFSALGSCREDFDFELKQCLSLFPSALSLEC